MPISWQRPNGVDQPEKTFLSKRGYAILKSENEGLEEYLKKVLTVVPKVNPGAPGGDKPTPYSLYKENTKKLYLPRAFGLDWFGAPTQDQVAEGEDAPGLTFKGTLRAEQEVPVTAFLAACKDPKKRGGILSMSCAAGKCLGKDTPVLMYDGTIKMVQDIREGDVLMGDDSLPRNVLSTCTGRETMYEVEPSRGPSYVVNKSHILSLTCVDDCSLARKGDIVDISVEEFLALPSCYHTTTPPLYGFRTGVKFAERNVPYDPYLLGMWLGDGASCIANNDLRHLLGPFKHIPMAYKCNSRRVRLKLIAGLIDADVRSSVSRASSLLSSLPEVRYEIVLQNETLADDVIYLARSLGFAAYKTTKKGGVVIFGCGTRIRNTDVRCIRTTNPLHVRIHLKHLGEGDYYGFEIDGNRRFLLGDFTVTHNTVMGLNIASQLGRKTLVICHKEFLLNQWRERIQMFLPDARVGLVKAKIVDVKDKDIVLASLQSLSMKEYDPDLFDQFGLVIVDECHRIAAEVFCRALPKVSCKYMLGLSATLNRKDGLRKVFEWYIGRPVYESKKRTESQMVIKVIPFYDPNPAYGRELVFWNGKKNVPQMINAICSYNPRTDLLISELKEIMKDPHRRVLVLSDRRNHLKELERRIVAENIGSIGYYVGGMKEEELKKSESKHILLATYSMASEGLDVPSLNTLILASPVSAIEQPIGRIQRQKPSERTCIPYTIDIWDQFSLFNGQGKRRIEFYRKNEYTIEGIDGGDCGDGENEEVGKKQAEFIYDEDEM